MSGKGILKKKKSSTQTPARPSQDAKWLHCCNTLKKPAADGSDADLRKFENNMTPAQVAETDFFNHSRKNEEYPYHLNSTTPTEKLKYFTACQKAIISKVPELSDLGNITVSEETIVHSRNYSLYSTILIALETDVDKVVKCADATCQKIFYERVKAFTTNWQKDMAQ